MAARLELDRVSVALADENGRKTVVHDVSLTLDEHRFVAVVGASGVGKSTLLRAAAGLIPVERGFVELGGQTAPDRRQRAVVFQEPRLLPWRRVLGNVEFGLEGLALTRAERRERAREALALVGLADLERRWPFQLSGGQQQRVNLARALATRPDVILLDEPFSALDALTRARLQDELLRIFEAQSASVMLVTHDIDEATYLADQVVVLAGSPGRVAVVHDITAERPRRRDDAALRAGAELIRRSLAAIPPPARRDPPKLVVSA